MKTLRSFGYAFKGIYTAICESSHVQFHLFAAAVVIAAGWYFNVSAIEWIVLILTMAAVISAEIVNTAIEDVSNVIRDKAGVDYAYTGKAKDMAAGAVLIFAVASVVIAAIIFIPKL